MSFLSLECILQYGKALTSPLYLCVYRCLDLGYGDYFLGGLDESNNDNNFLLFSGCSKVEFDGFDPTTTTVKWIIKGKK